MKSIASNRLRRVPILLVALLLGFCSVLRGEQPATFPYSVRNLRISGIGLRGEPIEATIKYNHRVIWTGAIAASASNEFTFTAATDFNEPPKPKYTKDGQIYLYLKTPRHASQWHVLIKTGETLTPEYDEPITLHEKKYAVLEYAFYQGDDPRFEGVAPTYSGVAAVGHWGSLPGFRSDWQLWQGDRRDDTRLWGDTLLIDHHRGTKENGVLEARATSFTAMLEAPRSGYVHVGGCGLPPAPLSEGKGYYFRVVGHTENTRGYGKIFVRSITTTVPAGIPVFER